MPRLIDKLIADTRELQVEADAEIHRLLGQVRPEHYKRFLVRTYGFVRPLERALVRTPDLQRFLDLRRLRKHELLRRDLDAVGVTEAEIENLPQCTSVPWFTAVPEALGWAFFIERHTLVHPNLFRHLATVMPGEVAFASSYLKCYFGAVGEMWRSFGDALDTAAPDEAGATQIVDAAMASFRTHKRWRSQLDRRFSITSEHHTIDG